MKNTYRQPSPRTDLIKARKADAKLIKLAWAASAKASREKIAAAYRVRLNSTTPSVQPKTL